nr:integrase, catalytic region, zinc finger, CCHC-type, peptidase aspartic, catalytic [Tanacetum cinerariifolium]
MSKSFEALQNNAINLEIDLQQCQEKIKNDKSFTENLSKEFRKEREHLNAKTLNVNSVCTTCDTCVLNDKHDMCVLNSVAKPIKKTATSESNQKPRNITRKLYERISKACSWWYPKSTPSGYKWKPKSGNENVNLNTSMPLGRLIEIVLFIVDSGCSKHMTGNLKLLINFVEKFLGTGNDLPTSSRGTKLYSITLQDTNSPNPICLMARATLSQAWLWYHRLSHLNFDTINLLSKNDIVACPKRTSCLKRIRHQMSVARTLEQNDVVERQNQTLVEAARTMLSASKSRAYRVFSKRTRVIMESIHVNFDKLPQMALDHVSSDPALECQRMALEHDSLSPAIKRQANVPQEDRTVTTSNELDLLFSLMFDELLNGSSKVVSKSSAVCSADAP